MTPKRSEDMMLTSIRSMDNGVMRLAIAFHKRKSIGEMINDRDASPRWVFQTTPEWNQWASDFMNLPGLRPRMWSEDPHWAEFQRLQDEAPGYERARFAKNYMNMYGPKRMLLVLDNEEQAMLFKMRWQDAT